MVITFVVTFDKKVTYWLAPNVLPYLKQKKYAFKIFENQKLTKNNKKPV